MLRFTSRPFSAALRVLPAAATFSLMLALPAAQAQNIAVVNGRPIPKSRADFFVKEQMKQGAPDSPELQKMVRDELITREALQQEAERRGLGDSEVVKQQLVLMKQAVLLNALREDYFANNKVSDSELQAEYNKIKQQYSEREYHARHILLETAEKADSLLKQLKGGAKFEDLAKSHSKDPGSAANGGDLDWAAPSNFVPEFASALRALKPGQTSEQAVKTQFGFHIIRVDDIRDAAPIPGLDEVKPQLMQGLLAQKWRKYQDDLRSKAVVK